MGAPPLNFHFADRRILVVEDDPLLGLNLKTTLNKFGCHVVGPVAAVAPALQVISASRVDAAVLDINLGAELSFPIADALTTINVPFLFVTAHGRAIVPAVHRNRPLLPKPFAPQVLVRELARVLGACLVSCR